MSYMNLSMHLADDEKVAVTIGNAIGSPSRRYLAIGDLDQSTKVVPQ